MEVVLEKSRWDENTVKAIGRIHGRDVIVQEVDVALQLPRHSPMICWSPFGRVIKYECSGLW